MTVSLHNNLSELDTLLADLNNARYAAENNNIQVEGGRSTVSNSNYAYGDYYSDLDSSIDDKPPSRWAITMALVWLHDMGTFEGSKN